MTTPPRASLTLFLFSGNVTAPNGRLIGNIIPGLGGENGYTDSAGVFHVGRQRFRCVLLELAMVTHNYDAALRITVKYLDGHIGLVLLIIEKKIKHTPMLW